jgi:hypothetical protein
MEDGRRRRLEGKEERKKNKIRDRIFWVINFVVPPKLLPSIVTARQNYRQKEVAFPQNAVRLLENAISIDALGGRWYYLALRSLVTTGALQE